MASIQPVSMQAYTVAAAVTQLQLFPERPLLQLCHSARLHTSLTRAEHFQQVHGRGQTG